MSLVQPLPHVSSKLAHDAWQEQHKREHDQLRQLTAQLPATATTVGLLLYPQTAAEIAVGVMPTTIAYPPLHVFRYGATGNGVTDDTAAINTALSVASQIGNVNGLAAAVTVPAGTFMLSSMVFLPSRVRVIGVNKRGSYFKATVGWTIGNGVSAYNAGTTYAVLSLVTSSGVLYISRQSGNLGNTPASSPTFWTPISAAMFYAQNGYSAGVGLPMFDSPIEQCSIDAGNVVGLGCVLSSAMQDGNSGLNKCLLLNFGTYGVRFQDFFGGADHSYVTDCEIFGGTITGQAITGITKAASAVVTVSTVSTLNPFILGSYIAFSGVVGMVQINGLIGNITAVGGVSGAWTATVNINSSSFTAYSSGGLANNTLGVDCSLPGGASAGYVMDVSGTVCSGGTGNLAAGIVTRGNSLTVYDYHPETCVAGVLVDGAGFVNLTMLTGTPTVGDLVQVASSFTGSAVLTQVRHNGATNTLNDLRTGGNGAVGAVDEPQWIISANSTDCAKGLAFPSAWCMFDGTAAGPISPTGQSYNVSSITDNGVGDYTINLIRAMLSNSAGLGWMTDLTPTAGNGVDMQLVSIANNAQIRVQLYFNGTLTDTTKISVVIFGG